MQTSQSLKTALRNYSQNKPRSDRKICCDCHPYSENEGFALIVLAYLFFFVIEIRRCQQVAEDHGGDVHLLVLVHHDRNTMAIVENLKIKNNKNVIFNLVNLTYQFSLLSLIALILPPCHLVNHKRVILLDLTLRVAPYLPYKAKPHDHVLLHLKRVFAR